MRALVVGGTGPTGPFIVNGLRERGYDVTIFHRGTHEVDEIPADVTHIHGDPHFRETIDDALAGHTFDLCVATYGRIRHVAEAMVGRTGRFVGVGGFAAYRGFMTPRDLFPVGLLSPVPEDAPVVATEDEERFSWLIAMTEDVVLSSHPTAAYFRYPYVYGPYQLVPREWSIVRRILDKRPHIAVPDGGLTLSTHGYAGNLAHAVLLAVDEPDASAGQIYNCGDLQQLSLRQIIEVIAAELDHEIEIVGVPHEAAGPAAPLALHSYHHRLMDLSKICQQLGYRDVLPAPEALATTARWYAEHRPEPGGAIEQRLRDPFDYDAEDELVALARESIDRMRQISFERHRGPGPHPYAHPREPGQARDHRDR